VFANNPRNIWTKGDEINMEWKLLQHKTFGIHITSTVMVGYDRQDMSLEAAIWKTKK
jgi:hypothetical protein